VTKGISHDILCDYVEKHQKIDAELRTIYSLSHLLAVFEDQATHANLTLDKVAPEHVHQLISKSTLNIWEILDDFIYIVEARTTVNENKT
jgi:hypothetical protein